MDDYRITLDNTDRRILAILQDARTAFTEIGRAVGLTSPAVKERVVRMEQAGLIKSYRADIDYTMLGRQLRAMVMLKVKSYDRLTERHNVSIVRKIDGVVRAWDVTGAPPPAPTTILLTREGERECGQELDAVLAKFSALGFATTTYLVLEDTGELPASPDGGGK